MLGRFVVTDPQVTFAMAVRNDSKGLWFTIHNILLNQIGTPYEGRVRVAVINNSDDLNERGYIKNLCERMNYFVDYQERFDTFSNHVARNAAVQLSKTEYTILCDSHVLFEKNFVEATLGVLKSNPQVGLVHSPFCTMGISAQQRLACFYNLQHWSKNMHGVFSRYGATWDEPFPIAIAPHAAMAFRTQQWLDYGGYINECQGHGGGEPFVTYKYWLYGSEVWCTPKTTYAHWRSASYRKSKGMWYQNFIVTAYALWGQKVGDTYAEKLKNAANKDNLWALAKPYYLAVHQKFVCPTYEEFLPYLRAKKARPLV